jgi:hypothetical protein
MPYLEHDGVTRELPHGETLVGSGSDVDWRLQTINLAPRHFTVHVDAAGVAVLAPCRARDVDVNGTAVTGPRALAQGDEIIAGAGIFAFLQALEPVAPTPAPPGTGGAYLIDIGAGLAYPLTDEGATIGRDPINQIAVRDPSLSRFHAEVRRTADGRGFAIRSMGAGGSSVNGVLVGGTPRELAEGDLLRIAKTTWRFTSAAPPAMLRIVSKTDVPPTPKHQSGAIQRAVEATTLGPLALRPATSSGAATGRAKWVTGVLLLTGALLVGLIVRAMHPR